jgi:hypothetical protein
MIEKSGRSGCFATRVESGSPNAKATVPKTDGTRISHAWDKSAESEELAETKDLAAKMK